MKPSMSTRPAPLATALPAAHATAANNTNARPSGVVLASVFRPITSSPAAASARAAHWKPRTRSPAMAIARPIVKKT